MQGRTAARAQAEPTGANKFAGRVSLPSATGCFRPYNGASVLAHGLSKTSSRRQPGCARRSHGLPVGPVPVGNAARAGHRPHSARQARRNPGRRNRTRPANPSSTNTRGRGRSQCPARPHAHRLRRKGLPRRHERLSARPSGLGARQFRLRRRPDAEVQLRSARRPGHFRRVRPHRGRREHAGTGRTAPGQRPDAAG